MLHALARPPFHFGIARFFLGIGEAGNWPAAIKLTSEWFPPAERSTASGIFNSGAAIGAVVAPPLIAYLGINYSWQTAFIIIGCLGYVGYLLFGSLIIHQNNRTRRHLREKTYLQLNF